MEMDSNNGNNSTSSLIYNNINRDIYVLTSDMHFNCNIYLTGMIHILVKGLQYSVILGSDGSDQ